MPFNEIKSQQLNDLRKQKDLSERSIFLANERIKKIEEQQEGLNRRFNAQNDQDVSLKDSLVSLKRSTDALIAEERGNLTRIQDEMLIAWRDFQSFTDPKEHLNRLDNHYPILLMPLRIETRFKKVKSDNGNLIDQLWVRVYPDDAAIDTFEETLSEYEIRDVQTFWTDWWAAAGDEGLRRAAWRALVDGHGHGRSQYMIDHYKPGNFEEILKSGDELTEPTVFLIINENNDIQAGEKAALSEFWKMVWQALGDADKIKAAKSDLDTELGEDRATHLAENNIPNNLNDDLPAVPDGTEIAVEVKFINFTPDLQTDSQKESWSKAPRVRVLPERLYLLGYRNDVLEIEELGNLIPFPLIIGPDPKIKEEDLIEIPGTDVKVSGDMKWMLDFEEAVLNGMGFKVNLSRAQIAEGFSKILVLGVKMSATRMDGKEAVEELIHNHYYGNSGFSFLPVGTPTNNTLNSPSGYSDSEDADESFDLVFKQEEETEAETDNKWWAKSDRKWFCEMMGISETVFENMINTDGFEQREARAMHTALWPTTWGYYMETMLKPALKEEEIEQIRWYFNHFVVGRGTIPSVRIDDQPYGILPTTAFSKITWINQKQLPIPADVANEIPAAFKRFFPTLHSKFDIVQQSWEGMLNSVSFVSKDSTKDPHQIMLDVLGLHGGSVEFHNRIGESLNHLYNLWQSSQKNIPNFLGFLYGFGSNTPGMSAFEQYFKGGINQQLGWFILTQLGYTGNETPEILEKLFVTNAEKLNGPLIDDVPLSDNNPIRVYSNGLDGTTPENYIQWLIRAADTSFDSLRKGEGFIDNKRPSALLYLMLKHALEQSFFEATLRLYQLNEVLSREAIQLAKIEPDFIHIREKTNVGADDLIVADNLQTAKPLDTPFKSESRYNLMYQKQEAITGSPDMLVADFIPQALKTKHFATRYLADQLDALRLLENTPTNRLEKSFAEHIDCASYRFDAWKFGAVNYQLKAMRNQPEITDDNGEINEEENNNQGVYIGAYGWLENVKSENKDLQIKELDAQQSEVFKPTEASPIYEDNTNLGFINAPSLNHAVTAAILRNGYLSRAGEENENVFNINLSSARVRKAIQVIEGIQNGQSLAALLGYQFERGIHDNNQNENVDHFVFKIRRKFPLAGNQMSSTFESDENIPIEAIEARNVVNGLDLIEFAEAGLGPNGEPDYFDDLGLEGVSGTEKDIIVNEINNIRDINDAVADLAFAESIHQVAQGNIDRAAGTLDTYSSGNYPQMPEVVQTPRSGVNLTQRVGLQIKADADPSVAGYTPRAMGEPGLNEFLADVLPALNTIRCYVSFHHNTSGNDITEHPISMADLNLQPIDLLFLISGDTSQNMDSLDDIIVNHTLNTNFPGPGGPKPPRPDAKIAITYFKVVSGFASVFEITPLIGHLKAILLRSKTLLASDVIKSNEAGDSANSNQSLNKQRIDLIIAYLNTPKAALDSYVSALETSLGEGGDDEATIISNIDANLSALVDILKSISLLGLPQTGIGFAYDWRKTQLEALFSKFTGLVKDWTDKETEYADLLSSLSGLPTDEEKIVHLLQMERVVSTVVTLDPGIDPVAFKSTVVDVKKASFDARKLDFENYLAGEHPTVSGALTASEAPLSYKEFYLKDTETDDVKKACLAMADELLNKAKLLQADLGKRIDAVTELLTEYASEADATKQVTLLQDAGKQLLGEDFKMIPWFDLPDVNKAEWQNGIDKVDDLLDYQIQTLENPLPVDEWFYGVARVREKITHMEQAVIMAEGFKSQTITLTPVQLPYTEPYCWLALEFGNEDEDKNKLLHKIFRENDHLLYTAWYHETFSSSNQQCGLIIDEWTEIVPTEEETTGVTFHYDRPNSEPPQSMLLALSPKINDRGWHWEDLVDTLHETLHEAKLRAVEPEQIDQTGYANLLPATVSTTTKYPISIMLNYALNNARFANIQIAENE
jgi:hypothetical protein